MYAYMKSYWMHDIEYDFLQAVGQFITEVGSCSQMK